MFSNALGKHSSLIELVKLVRVFLKQPLNQILIGIVLIGISSGKSAAVERPSIWVKNTDRAKILDKINTQPWASSLFTELKQRVDPLASESLKARKTLVQQLPFVLSQKQISVLPRFQVKGGGTEEQWERLSKTVLDGVDCGVLYYLTQEDKYGNCAADVLHNVVFALKHMPVDITTPTNKATRNAGWLFPNNHLFETRGIGAQLPIIYDLIYPYIAAQNKVYNYTSNQLTAFDFVDAQDVFKTYLWLALNRGDKKSNWSVIESPSLLHNALALDNPQQTKQYITQYLSTDSQYQMSFNTLASHYKNAGDIWPESLNYSKRVGEVSIYILALLERYDSTLELANKYPNLLGNYKSYYNLQFPNDDYPFIGDGDRQYEINYPILEMSLSVARKNKNSLLTNDYDEYLASSVKKDLYDRGELSPRFYGGRVYTTPLQLLWNEASLTNKTSRTINSQRPRTAALDYAGMVIQRNTSFKDSTKNGLMAYVAGASYIHGHASGMDMELYGQGHVLGIDGGKGIYKTNTHENYYRLFAAHNTVISNGSSGSEKRWVNLGIKKVQQVAMEPLPNQPAVSPNHSFSISSFWDKFNLVSQAEHERTLALIKVSDTQGYYVDIFRAKARKRKFGTYGMQYHDYVYHNIGENVAVTSEAKPVSLKSNNRRYLNNDDLPWVQNKHYRHPGWHFFKDVKSTQVSSRQHEITFTASKLGDEPIYMRAISPSNIALDFTTVMAPPSVGAPLPYQDKPLPTFIARKQGDAWQNPFVFVYESTTGNAGFAVKSVERLMDKRGFNGLKIKVDTGATTLTQYVILNRKLNSSYRNDKEKIYFKGHFAVISVDDQTQKGELYMGSGYELSYGGKRLYPNRGATAGYKTF
ncbi:hypothetical protein C2869_06820 [Saccharobesus litoralis]|uniref:Heparinase II/III-like protein n=1 Tax=Saccharobesus litoralis TaxID=2172099 RepID=A0A2S0VPL9_9ALTE|nr:heparinase II/III family protein [Saccharobesus litoralis]AWB66165.1 hypothetical protein C2869_06820 [Saccharobesus litoralis]